MSEPTNAEACNALAALREGLHRAAMILCETRSHAGARPCTFCAGQIVAPYEEANLAARGVGLAAPPASDEPERARIIREIAGRAAFYHGQPGADVDFLLGEVRRVRLARPDGGTETP